MSLAEEDVREPIDVYIRAWTTPELLGRYLDGSTATAEWERRFDDVVEGDRKRMREVAILELERDRIASLRESWSSERLNT
jgi:hypothetical protein